MMTKREREALACLTVVLFWVAVAVGTLLNLTGG